MITYIPTEYGDKLLRDSKFYADLSGRNHTAIDPVFYQDSVSLNSAASVYINFRDTYASIADVQNAPQKSLLHGSLTLSARVVAGPADYEVNLISLVPGVGSLNVFLKTAVATETNLTLENIRSFPEICFNAINVNLSSVATEIIVQYNFIGLRINYY